MKKFFEIMSKSELSFSDKFNDRDFVHLYDFQKYFIHKTIKGIMDLVEIKQYHYWNVKRDISSWEKLSEYFVNTFISGLFMK